MTVDKVLFFYRRLNSGYYSGKERGSTCKGKYLVQINLWRVVDFPSDIFLVQLSLGMPLMYCVSIFYNLYVTLTVGIVC